MADIYVRLIKLGVLTLDKVPALWRDAVREKLGEATNDMGIDL